MDDMTAIPPRGRIEEGGRSGPGVFGRRPVRLILGLTCALGLVSCAPSAPRAPALWGELEPGPHAVGYRRVVLEDSSRVIPGAAPAGDASGPALPFRPVILHLWYPARGMIQEGFPFGTYARFAAEDARWPDTRSMAESGGPGEELPLRRGLSEEGWRLLLGRSTAAEYGLRAAEGPFPLVLVGQGLYYEAPLTHAVFCEYLASHGYVVATSPLLGRASRWVRLDVGDLEAQVRDLEFLFGHSGSLGFVRQDRTALIGFDMGGMSSVILAMRNPAIRAMVSVESGILFEHPSGLPFTSPGYDPDQFRVPWLHITRRSVLPGIPEAEDEATLFGKKPTGESYLLLTDSGQHMEFTSYAMYGIEEPLRNYWARPAPDARDRYQALGRLVLDFLDDFVGGDRPAGTFPSPNLEAGFEALGFSLMHKGGKPPPPDFDAFISEAGAAGLSAAITRYEAILESSPETTRFSEAGVNAFGYRLLYFEGDVHDAIQVFRLNTRLYPTSANVWDSLGEAYYLGDDVEAAIPCYERALELEPNSANARTMLKLLTQGPNQPGGV